MDIIYVYVLVHIIKHQQKHYPVSLHTLGSGVSDRHLKNLVSA